MQDLSIYQKARLSRDKRFDGIFFVAVKSTGIYCRPICPANIPQEKNVEYFSHAIEAATAGYRPCLRCRPDSAPGSPAWQGTDTTLKRAIKLINQGALSEGKLENLADRLGISERYLRQLFQKSLGTSPKSYALYQQALFAKQLLHQTKLPITQVALASGFNSIRRFNDYFKTELQLTPSAIRKSSEENTKSLQLHLSYRPPYNWQAMQSFLMARYIPELEWCTDTSYGRTFQLDEVKGSFNATHISNQNKFVVDINLSDFSLLHKVVNNIRRVLDLDADSTQIEQDLANNLPSLKLISGLRLPGTWSLFESGIRAILGQQVSIKRAKDLVQILVRELGEPFESNKAFPQPKAIAENSLEFLGMPTARKQTLRSFAEFHLHQPEVAINPDTWMTIKGIGSWTIDYAKMRGLSDPDIYLSGDLGVKNAIKKLPTDIDADTAAPWRSYLTLQLWSQI